MDAQEYIDAHRDRFIAQLQELLRIPSVSSLSEHRGDVRRAAEWIANDLRAIGLHGVDVIDDPAGGHPLVYGEHLEASGAPTVLIYGHYDVQPPDPLDLWRTPPFEPTIMGENLYCRGASDDKGQAFALLKGVEACLRGDGRLPTNVKVLIEGEEEISGRHIDTYVRAHAERLRADTALIADSAMFAPGVPALCTALRGIVYTEIRVLGADHDLHSGEYGGPAPNALDGLVTILHGLKDSSTGRVLVPGFYDAVLSVPANELDTWSTLPFDTEAFMRDEIGATALVGEEQYSVLERLWSRPTLDINGAIGGFTGEGSKTVIPARAMAKVSMRLVPNQDPHDIFRAFERHVRALCSPGISVEIVQHGAAAPVLLPADTPAMRAAADAFAATFDRAPVHIRMGGSIPIAETFQRAAGIPATLAGFGLPDDNLHAPNEKMYIPNIIGGARFTARFLHRFDAA